MHPVTAFELLTVLQTGLNATDPNRPTCILSREIAIELQDRVAPSGPLAQVCALGWRQ